jgi:hypothetical protein
MSTESPRKLRRVLLQNLLGYRPERETEGRVDDFLEASVQGLDQISPADNLCARII